MRSRGRRRPPVDILFTQADGLAGNSGNDILHGYGGIFTGKKLPEIDAKSFRHQHRPGGDCRLGEVVKTNIHKNRAFRLQFPECSLGNFRHVVIKRLPEIIAWDADPNAAQVRRSEFRSIRNCGVHERNVGDVARHRAGNVEGDFQRDDPIDRIKLIGLGVGRAKTCDAAKMSRYPN